MLEDGKHVLRKHFFDKREAEMQALHYLGQIGVLNSGNLSKEKEKSTISRHSGIYYSDARSMWGVKVKGYRGIIEAKRKPSRPKRITWLKNQPSRRQ